MSRILYTIQNEFAPTFALRIGEIFNDNLKFGFICGGFSKGYADEYHDIDMFVCVDKLNPTQIGVFKNWYFDVHKHYGLPCDENDPGEIVAWHKLKSALAKLKTFSITTLKIEDYEIYEAIVWGDMLSDKVIGISGNVSLLSSIQHECKNYPAIWKFQVLDLLPAEKKEAVKNEVPQLLMEKYMIYPKNH